MKYQEFRERNPTFQSRIEALTSGLLTPDTKGIALWSMEHGIYGPSDIYGRVMGFCGVNRFPVIRETIWEYFNGNSSLELEGSLYSIGAVVKMEVERQPGSGLWVARYQITDAGEELGKPLAGRATALVNILEESRRRTGEPNFCSIWRIFGHSKKDRMAEYRSGYSSYLVIKALSDKPEKEFTVSDLTEETGLDQSTVSDVIKKLSDAGLIFCEQLTKHLEGKRPRDWSVYRVNDIKTFLQLNPDEVYREVRTSDRDFYLRNYLVSIIELIKLNPLDNYTRNSISKRLKIRGPEVSRTLSILRRLGYLTGSERSLIKANDFTKLIWEILLEPLEVIAHDLDTHSYPEFERFLRIYQENEKDKIRHLHTHLEVYQRERSYIGPQGGKEIRSCIFQSLMEGEKKPSQIVADINKMIQKGSGRHIGKDSLWPHLKKLRETGKIEKTPEGKFRIVVS